MERLRAQVVEAAASVRGDGGAGAEPTLERPPRAEFGDFSTNVAMLLAPALKAPPREIAERVGDALNADSATRSSASRSPGPGFLNLFLSDSWFRRALAAVRERGEAFGSGVVPGRRARARAGGVRERQSDRPAERGGRPARRVRRLPGARARLRGPRGRARVLRERLRLPGGAVRALDRRSDDGRARPRGRLPGRVRHRAGRAAARGGAGPR